MDRINKILYFHRASIPPKKSSSGHLLSHSFYSWVFDFRLSGRHQCSSGAAVPSEAQPGMDLPSSSRGCSQHSVFCGLLDWGPECVSGCLLVNKPVLGSLPCGPSPNDLLLPASQQGKVSQWDGLHSFAKRFIFIFGCARSSLLCRLFSSSVIRGYSLLQCTVFSFYGFSCCRAQALELVVFNSCNSQALEHKLNNCGTQA